MHQPHTFNKFFLIPSCSILNHVGCLAYELGKFIILDTVINWVFFVISVETEMTKAQFVTVQSIKKWSSIPKNSDCEISSFVTLSKLLGRLKMDNALKQSMPLW
jgi:hypothetical protein